MDGWERRRVINSLSKHATGNVSTSNFASFRLESVGVQFRCFHPPDDRVDVADKVDVTLIVGHPLECDGAGHDVAST